MNKKYTPEMIDFLKQNVIGRSVKELTLMVNAYFCSSFTERQIDSAKYQYGLRSGTKRTGMLTPEQIKFLENNIRGKPFAEVSIIFNKHFKTDFTSRQIKDICFYKGLKSNLFEVKGVHYWKEEEISFLKKYAGEKTTRELTVLINNAFNLSLKQQNIYNACSHYKIKITKIPAKCPREIVDFIRQNSKQEVSCLTKMINDTFETAFSRYQVNRFFSYYKYDKTVYKNKPEHPVYKERITGSHIYIKVPTSGPYKKRWHKKSRWIWEQANGKIPEGMIIIFLDNNPLNCALENLAMVSRAEQVKLSQLNLRSDNKEITLAGIAVVKHLIAVHNQLEERLGKSGHKNFISNASRKRMRERKKREM
jgi:hypothetical protein